MLAHLCSIFCHVGHLDDGLEINAFIGENDADIMHVFCGCGCVVDVLEFHDEPLSGP